MVELSMIVFQGAKLGYERYGPKGAVVGAVVAGGSILLVKEAVARFTDVEDARIEELAERVQGSDDLDEIIDGEFEGFDATLEEIAAVVEEFIGGDDSGFDRNR